MKLSEDLKSVIEAALADRKISKKEREVLLRKAEKEGIDKDEFEIYLDGRLHNEKVSSGTDGNLFKRMYRFINKSEDFKALIYWFICVVPIALLIFWGITKCSSCSKNDSNNRTVDEYILQNKFQEALQEAIISKAPNSNTLKVLKAELTYWLSAKDVDRAIEKINEMKKISIADDDLTELDLNKAIYESSIDLIRTYCEQGQKEKAENFAGSLIESFQEKIRDEYIESKRQYEEIKKALPSNEQIDPFIDDGRTHYIYKIYHPKAEALKIIEECKKYK